MGLGSASVFDLATARERAKRERQKLADGTDPLEARRADRAAQRAAAAQMPLTSSSSSSQSLGHYPSITLAITPLTLYPNGVVAYLSR